MGNSGSNYGATDTGSGGKDKEGGLTNMQMGYIVGGVILVIIIIIIMVMMMKKKN